MLKHHPSEKEIITYLQRAKTCFSEWCGLSRSRAWLEMAASDLQKRVSALPRELQQKIMYNAYPDPKTLRQQGHILVTEDRTVSLPSSMTVRVFLVGGGGGVIPSRFFVDQIEWGGGGSGHLTKGQLVVPDSGEISVTIGRSRRSGLGGFGHPTIVVAEKSLITGGGEVRNGDGGSGWSGGAGSGIHAR